MANATTSLFSVELTGIEPAPPHFSLICSGASANVASDFVPHKVDKRLKRRKILGVFLYRVRHDVKLHCIGIDHFGSEQPDQRNKLWRLLCDDLWKFQ
jgi:hypothetical protein